MIASKVICDDTYSNQSWGIVAQKMFALKEINQMEREMCGYLEWNLNVGGDEVTAFEARVRSEHGPKAVARASTPSIEVPIVYPTVHPYPTPDTTPDTMSRPIRPVPSPYKSRPSYRQQATFPSPPSSPTFLDESHFASNNSSLVSSPASDDCKTPSPVAVVAPPRHPSSSKPPPSAVDMARAFDLSRAHGHAHHPINVQGW